MQMTLYDFLMENDNWYDSYDDVYDVSVTVGPCSNPKDDYDEFCVDLAKKIEVKEINSNGDPICGWSDYIKRNLKTFRKFANENWIKNNYEDEDDFICEWIEELHRFLAGYGDTDQYWFYKQELVDNCK